MHTFMLMSPKGGAGKSTMAVVMAGEGAKAGKTVTMIDADPNYPLHKWKNRGHSPDTIQVMQDHDPEGGTIQNSIEKAQANSDLVIVDTEGTANRRVQIAALIAHLVIIPFNTSALDIDEAAKAVSFLTNLSKETGQNINYLLAPTQVDFVQSKTARNDLEQVRKAGFPMISKPLMRRPTFRDMFSYGATLHTMTIKDSSGVTNTRTNAAEFMTEVMEFYASKLNEERAVA